MLAIEQIKAARGLLNWTQEQLADAASVSLPTIKQVERSLAAPRVATIEAIRQAFEQAGVAFTEHKGVKLRTHFVDSELFTGKECLNRLWSEVAQMLRPGEERLMIGMEAPPADVAKAFAQKKVRARILLPRGDTNFTDPNAEYKWLPRAYFPTMPRLIYGNCCASILASDAAETTEMSVMVMRSEIMAEAERAQFNLWWQHAIDLPYKFTVKTK